MKPCNKCNQPFDAASPFNRTCPTCTESNSKVSKRGGSPGSGLPHVHVGFNMSHVKEIREVQTIELEQHLIA